MTRQQINLPVYVTSLVFSKNFSMYPRRMEYLGKTYEFVDAGVRCQVKSGGILSEILTMSDGKALYQLKSCDRGSSWTLVSIIV